MIIFYYIHQQQAQYQYLCKKDDIYKKTDTNTFKYY